MTRLLVTILLSLPLVGAYAINAIGVVVVYRASKVLNLAHGALTMLAAYSAYQIVQSGMPRPVGLAGGIIVSVGLALLVERLFVRRLRSGGPTAQTIGTVAAFGVMVAVAGRVWGTTPRQSVAVFPEHHFSVSNSLISYGQIGLFVSMLLVAGLLYVLLNRTYLGLVLRGTAENRVAASLMGADPDRMTQLAWALGGALAGIAGEMLAAVGSLHPYNLALAALPAFVAALLGGMESLPGAVIGAAVVGLVEGLTSLVGFLKGVEGHSQIVIAVLALVVMASRGARLAAGDATATGFETATRTPGRRRSRPAARLVIGIAILALPWSGLVSYSLLGNLNIAAIYAVVAVSLVVLTGWVGQISLAHATFWGIGAFVTGLLTANHVAFPISLPLAAAAAGLAAGILGTVALRVRGLYLAVATLIFAWMGERFLFRQAWLTRHAAVPTVILGRSHGFPHFDLSDRRVFFYVAWAVAGLACLMAANLRDTKTGRAFFAVQGSEVAAASLGVDVTRYKLLAFVLSGALAGAAGNLLMISSLTVVSDQFKTSASLFFLAVLVVGGIRSLGGAIAASLVFALLQQLFFTVRSLGSYLELVSALMLAVVLLLYRRGLAGVPESLDRIRARLAPIAERLDVFAGPVRERATRASGALRQRLPAFGRGVAVGAVAGDLDEVVVVDTIDAGPITAGSTEPRPPLPVDRNERNALLEASGITVIFGGLTAVDNVSLSVREGEIVGLIGPNGAGKTTTFNAISGLVTPTDGEVRLFGTDVTNMPMHRRAQLGMARTFQLIQLFPQLTVFDNLLVATHLKNGSGVLDGALADLRCVREEAGARQRARAVVELLGLHDVADRLAGGLPFGVLRMVEVGRALVMEPKLIMLDEPASGLDNTETDRLSELLLSIRDLGVGLLLIEHDVRMVTGVSDYMYVLDRGKPLAEGSPAEVQRHPDVIAAYLGQAGADAEAGRAATSEVTA